MCREDLNCRWIRLKCDYFACRASPVMTVPEVSSYLHVHPTTILQAAEAQSDSGLSRRQ